ncbi:histone-lysine N-methyltransferase SUVR3 isoform X2 [Carica papaya]|uniref:histone-lysine N-methyltransferase SUVR3 isoform X2 n=1 Tax=Carica papaya TaxID=3649 RepID=UPI000B8CDD57|nr:histone-lysine N-methyltransferase SUVR3 isoform X2 [Carica papaya]
MSQQWRKKFHHHHQPEASLLHCADLILPWLTPVELANVSLTCKILNQLAKSLTLHRSLDVSRSLETFPIRFHNLVDHHPYAFFMYTPSQVLPSSPSKNIPRQSWGLTCNSLSRIGPKSVTGSPGCDAGVPDLGSSARLVNLVDEAGEAVSGCRCRKCEEVDDNGGFGCPCRGLEGMGIVTECGPSCGCGLECGNRMSQRGISVRLKIVRDGRKGWSLYADQPIQQGEFVCELVTTEEARRRQEAYDKFASAGRFSSALLVVREHLPSGKACLRINIDATRVGNVARFINHSCDGGNLSTALIRSTGILLPRLCFFASKNIKQDEELTFSYGDIRMRANGLQCFCSSSCCFGVLPSEDT